MLDNDKTRNIIILNMSAMLSQMIIGSALYDGFSTFLSISMTSKFISVNQWLDHDDNIELDQSKKKRISLSIKE